MLNHVEIKRIAEEKIQSYHNESQVWTIAELAKFRIWRKRLATYLRNISDRLEPIPNNPLNLERAK